MILIKRNNQKKVDTKTYYATLNPKKNQCRFRIKGALHEEVVIQKEGKQGKRKRQREEEEKKKKEFEEKLKANDVQPDRYYRLHQTQETQDLKEKVKNSRKNHNEIDIYGDEVQYRSFKRRREQTNFSKEEYEKQKNELGEDFYRGTQNLSYGTETRDSETRVDGLVKELAQQVSKRNQFSRRRTWYEDRDIDFINERNRKFNQKVARAFDQYTSEIRENLERGTAL